MEDVLVIISEFEKKAETIIEDAKKEATQIILEAQNLAKEKKEEILKLANQTADRAIEDKKVLGQFETKRILAEATEKMKEIEKTADGNMNKAVSFILNLA